VAAFHQGMKLRGDVYKHELLPLLPFMLAGLVAGVFLLIRLSGEILLLTLGVFVFVYGVYYALRHDSVLRLARWSVAPIGLSAGTASSLFGMGGPLYVMYLTGRGATPDHIRATMPVIFSFTTVARIALFTATGLFSPDVLITAARLHLNLSREIMVRIIGGLLVVSGISLVIRAV